MLSFSKNHRYRIAVEKWTIDIASLWKLTFAEVYNSRSWQEKRGKPKFIRPPLRLKFPQIFPTHLRPAVGKENSTFFVFSFNLDLWLNVSTRFVAMQKITCATRICRICLIPTFSSLFTKFTLTLSPGPFANWLPPFWIAPYLPPYNYFITMRPHVLHKYKAVLPGPFS